MDSKHYCSGKKLIKTAHRNPEVTVEERTYLCPVCETVWSCAEITLKNEERLAIRRDGKLIDVLKPEDFKRPPYPTRNRSESEPLS